METVKVKFPEGIREVPAFFLIEEWGIPTSHGFTPLKRTPHPMDGWVFRGVIGGEAEWHAYEAPTAAERQATERRWRKEYEIDYSDRNGLNEDYNR